MKGFSDTNSSKFVVQKSVYGVYCIDGIVYSPYWAALHHPSSEMPWSAHARTYILIYHWKKKCCQFSQWNSETVICWIPLICAALTCVAMHWCLSACSIGSVVMHCTTLQYTQVYSITLSLRHTFCSTASIHNLFSLLLCIRFWCISVRAHLYSALHTAQQMHSCHDGPGGCPSEISKGCPGPPREVRCGRFDMQIMALVFTFEMI